MKRLLAISLAVVLALGLVAGDVMALTQPSVSLDNDIISATGKYTIMFTIAEDVAEGEDIIIAFPDDTDITDVDTTDCTIAATSGIGSNAFVAKAATSISKSDAELTITVPDVNTQDKIGTGAMVEVIANDVQNPSFPGDYTLTVATSGETTPVESASYAIETPTIPPVPGIVQLYNPVDILMAQYTGDDAIQSAIDDAWVGWTVKIGAGTYKDNIELKDGVQVLGEGADVTTIDGGGTGSVVTAIGIGSETVLDGFTITNGAVPTWGDGGGGMYNLNSSPVVTNCLFSSNSALSDGGGMYNVNSSPTVTNCTFSNNSATAGWGGGIRNHNSSPTVTNCIFSENSAAGAGGGMYNYASSPVLVNCIFSGNLAERGAGMFNTVSSSPTVINCTFFGNSTVDTGAAITFSGGGTFNDRDSAPMVTNCTFSNNSAIGYGGGMYNEDGSPMVTDCSFIENSASSGGGMYNYHAATMVTNCILSNNSATLFGGGGMSNHSSSPTVVNCTFSNNSAAKWGDGMFNFESSPTITDCIFWENGEEIFWFGSLGLSVSVTYCDVQGGHSGVGNIDADPMFIDLAAGDYHLKSGSPCIDAGTNAGAPTEDIEGNPRPIDGDGDGTATTDMGAYEYVPPAEPAIEATVDFDPDTLNLKSKGKVVTVYIELPEGYDVEEIDISTVMLNGIVPALARPTDVGDYDSDGVPDLMVKFDRADVQDVLEPGNEVEVTVSGQLTDGTLFEDTDTIRVIEKGRK